MSNSELIATDKEGASVLYYSIVDASLLCAVSEEDIKSSIGNGSFAGGFRWGYVKEKALTYNR